MSTFTADDGTVINLSSVTLVDVAVGNNGGTYYNVHLSSGDHIAVKESYKTRSTFITEWQAVI